MKTRVHIPELLDLPGASPEEVAGSLADLRRYNRWLGGYRVLLGILRRELVGRRLREFSLLDVGSGSGDLGALVKQRFPAARVVLSDIKPDHLPSSGLPSLAAPADRLPFGDRSFDFVSACLLMHQFPDPEAVRVLQSLGRVARRAVLVSDLERCWLPWLFLHISKPVFARSRLTRHDAPASVRQAFRPEELASLAREAGFRSIQVRRHRPWFRLSMVASCD